MSSWRLFGMVRRQGSATVAAFTTISAADTGGLRHHVPELSCRREFNRSGAAMENDMADTAVDAALWLILAAMIGWVTLGCFVTARHHRGHATWQSSRH
jgi:hypothetical protein